jgi:hypothetical protein
LHIPAVEILEIPADGRDHALAHGLHTEGISVKQAISLLVLFLLGGQSDAYVRSTTDTTGAPLAWRNPTIALRLSSAGSQDLGDGSELEALRRAVASWEAATPCSAVRFTLLPPSPEAAVGYIRGGVNETAIVWVEHGWEKDSFHDPSMLALTVVKYLDAPGTERDGAIVDADIELNGEGFVFSGHGQQDKIDLENTFAHELGHVLGLDHPCYLSLPGKTPTDHLGSPIGPCGSMTSPEILNATMFPSTVAGETLRRTPKADESAGVCAIYPRGDPADEGGCSLSGRPVPAPGLVLVVLFFLATCRRCRHACEQRTGRPRETEPEGSS